MKHLTSLLIIGTSLTLVLFLVIYLNYPNQTTSKEPEAFCGVVGEPSNTIPGFKSGKNLFRMNCAQCHSKNMVSNSTGPGLGVSIQLWENDTLSLLNYLNDSEDYFSTQRDMRLMTVKKSYGLKNSHKNNLSLEELRQILLYINMSK